MNAQQIRDQISKERQAARQFDMQWNEGGEGYNPHRARIDSLERQLGAAIDEEYDEAVARWRTDEESAFTLEVTVARRAEWNAWVRANSKNGTLAPLHVAEQIKRQGWSTDALKRAIKRHGL